MSSIYKKAEELATQKFESNEKARRTDAVCAVAIHITDFSQCHAVFSGKLGYDELIGMLCPDGNRSEKSKAGDMITNHIVQLLKDNEFTKVQINSEGLDPHGRGAMNCAEPKIYFLLKYLNKSLRNWVIIPFSWGSGGAVYNPPCMNCRRWVYKHFHLQSALIALQQGKGIPLKGAKGLD